jgi:hypothetical protein
MSISRLSFGGVPVLGVAGYGAAREQAVVSGLDNATEDRRAP